MPLEFASDCCDAQHYVALGEACAANFSDCWHKLRPIGSLFYFSLPFRLGLRPASLIILNAVLVLLAALVGIRALLEVSSGVTRVTRTLLALGSLVVTVCFTAELSRNSLSDVPAAAFVLAAIWSLVLAGLRGRVWLYGAAGAALGTSTILRAFYLYPGLLAAACLILLLTVRREPVARVAAFCAALFVPIGIQLLATHANVNSWSFIDPASAAAGERLHFRTSWYGYDTVLPGRSFWYAAPECFPGSAGMGDALRTGHWADALCLVAHRQWFYFGSYVWGGRTYLHAPDERHFSVALLVMNGAAVVITGLWALLQARRARTLFVPLVLLGAIWGEGSLIIPEGRFFAALNVAVWMLALAGSFDLARGLLARRSGASPGDDGLAWIPAAFSARIDALRRWRPSVSARDLLTPRFLAPATALAAVLVVHSMVLGSDLQDEDLRHVYESQRFETYEFLVRPYGNHFCAFFRLWVALLHWCFGVNALGYFAVVLLAHLLHVAFLYGIVRALTQSRFIAALAAGLWGSSPAFQGTLQWFAAYSHMLGTTALLWPLWELARAREEQRPPTLAALVRISLAVFLGAGTELTGSLVAVLFPLMAFAFLPWQSAPVRTALALVPSAILSALVVWAYAGESNATVTALFAWQPVLRLFGQLVVYGVGILAIGPFVSLGATEVTWLARADSSTAVAVSVVVFAPFFVLVIRRIVRGDWDERRVLLAAVGLAGVLYAAIAAGRAGLASGRPLSWLATRDRYHYEASVGLIIAMAVALARTFPRLSWPAGRRAAALAGALGVAWLSAGRIAAARTYLHGGGRQQWTRDWSDLTETSLRLMLARVPVGYTLYVRNDAFRPASLLYAMGATHLVFPGIGAYWVVAHGVDDFEDRRIRFVVMDRELLRRIRARSRPDIAGMFVSPGEVRLAGGEIRTIEADTPREVVDYLLSSPDPMFAPNDHARADRLRALLQEAAGHRPVPFGPPPVLQIPDDLPPPPPPPPASAAERQAMEDFRKAIENDPKAQEELRQAILNDPKALEEVREALRKQSEDTE